ncbi:MAG: hypothetical protein ACRES5_04045, partial [Pseudomonas sp.]
RFLFSAWQAYALAHGASSLLVIFLVFELAWGVVQVLPVRTPSRAGSLPHLTGFTPIQRGPRH